MTLTVGKPLLNAPVLPAGFITGTVKISGTPDVPVRRWVQLWVADLPYHRLLPDYTLLQAALSAADGSYHFVGLDPAKYYAVVSYDHTGVYDPVVKMNLIPEV